MQSYKVALGLPTTGGPAPEEKKEKDGETVAKLG